MDAKLRTMAVCFLGVSLLITGCGPGQLFGPTVTPTPTNTPTPTSGIGVPAIGGSWKVTITGVREVAYYGSSTPTDGYSFLVIDVKIRNLLTEITTLTTDMAAIVDEFGDIHTADGGDLGSSECVGCVLMAISTESELNINFVFELPKQDVKQPFKFQFGDTPLIPFSLK